LTFVSKIHTLPVTWWEWCDWGNKTQKCASLLLATPLGNCVSIVTGKRMYILI